MLYLYEVLIIDMGLVEAFVCCCFVVLFVVFFSRQYLFISIMKRQGLKFCVSE